jgi:hypothetical protein
MSDDTPAPHPVLPEKGADLTLDQILASADAGGQGDLMAHPGDFETSDNDDQDYRDPDIHIAEVVAALESLINLPWTTSLVSPENMPQCSLLGWLSKQLNSVSVDPVSTSNLSAVAAVGSTNYVQVGQNKVIVPTSKDAHSLSRELRTGFRSILKTKRRAVASTMRSGGATLLRLFPADKKVWVVSCGQTSACFTTEHAAASMCTKLNNVYKKSTDPWVRSLQQQLNLSLDTILAKRAKG